MYSNELERNKEMLSKFLVDKPIPKQFKVETIKFNEPVFGYIYCIENNKSKKKYIGSVYSIWSGVRKSSPIIQLRKRATNYLYEYNNAIKNCKTSAKKTYRPIIQAMIDDGFDNFVMYPLAETTRDNHNIAEKYFIDLYDTIKNGYNIIRGGAGTERIGKRLMKNDKLLRSEGILAINIKEKKLVFSDSMKLFGDFMNSSKDMIKNANRKGRPYKGWYVFYIDPYKRAEVLGKNVIGDGLPKNDRHSEKSKEFYKELYTSVTLYLRDFCKTEYFSDFETLKPLEYTD